MLRMDDSEDLDQGSRLKELLGLCLGKRGEAEDLTDSFGLSNLSPSGLGEVKAFAKGRFLSSSLSEEEREVAGVLYYQALAVGWKRNRQLVSGLSEDEFLRGCEWVLALPWLDLETRVLFGDVVGSMDQGDLSE